MGRDKPCLYIFGWPSFVGGADTKLAHLLLLLRDHFSITVVPNENRHLHDKPWMRRLRELGVAYGLLEQLPGKLEGIGLGMSNQCFFTHTIAQRAKERGLRIIWSSEMMWHHKGELEAVKQGIIDKVLYVSEVQKEALAPGYGALPSAMTGNYIDPAYFPFKERRNPAFTIGRLSRAAPEKYPEDFPVFYEALGVPECRFRVMAWDDKLKQKYRWHKFDDRWDLLPAERQSSLHFLQSLDLFVYPLGHRFTESWGRSTVEAMLTGCIPLAPPGHHLDHLIVHGETGFVCGDFLEYHDYAHRLYRDPALRRRLATQCRRHATENLCNRERHLRVWIEALQ
ncbi:MAG: glycosyltransferase family 4 protein [Verrucomicrobia bacterium]|nr:glycosyltransferase family 4 protein [Verrucomicrobiota bacterium]